MKYQLLRIAEILSSWAKFTKSSHLETINELHIMILTDNPDFGQLEKAKADFWDIIIDSNDRILYLDLQQYFTEDQFNTDPGTMTTST